MFSPLTIPIVFGWSSHRNRFYCSWYTNYSVYLPNESVSNVFELMVAPSKIAIFTFRVSVQKLIFKPFFYVENSGLLFCCLFCVRCFLKKKNFKFQKKFQKSFKDCFLVPMWNFTIKAATNKAIKRLVHIFIYLFFSSGENGKKCLPSKIKVYSRILRFRTPWTNLVCLYAFPCCIHNLHCWFSFIQIFRAYAG